jgi:hypothetical protein
MSNSSAAFLHRIDYRNDRLTWVDASRQDLEEAVFLDGRTKFWRGERTQPLGAALAAQRERPRPLTRMILHVSFCGSTLLARSVGRASTALVLKEAHCLVDLADWQLADLRSSRADPRFSACLDLALSALSDSGAGEGAVVIKPSNWANTLLPLLCRDPALIRPVFITMSRAGFLVAVLRGGRDRLAFTARVAAHLAGLFVDGEALIAKAIGRSRDPLLQTANLVMLAHHFQHRLFDDACRAGGWGADRVFDFNDIVSNLGSATRRVLVALGIDANAVQPVPMSDVVSRNAKQPERSFSRLAEASDNDFVRETYEDQIAAALAWARDHLEEVHIAGDSVSRSPQRAA